MESDSQNQQQNLCKRCGLCCNGVIFARLRLDVRDDAAQLGRLLPLKPVRCATPNRSHTARQLQLPQPCAAFIKGQCAVYAQRPIFCREFQCLLLQAVTSGSVSFLAASRRIDRANRLVRNITRWLLQMGEDKVDLPITTRYRRVMTQAEQRCLRKDEAAILSDLSQAMHKLNLELSEHFYPGA